ncbi:MAG: LptF/LptG family permease, partial [Candidatus Omnitrophica bacterium]|nr:LptF/LptG family permease [Candidatus Omnitrophota bacterium]
MISVLVFWMNERFVPESYQSTREIKQDNMMIASDVKRRKQESIKNLTFYGLNNRLFYVHHMNPSTNELYGITIIEYDENARIKEKVVALEGKWTGLVWKFFTCNITTYGEGGISQPLKVKVYKEKLMDIKEDPEDFMRQRVKVSAMNLKELREYINRFSSSGATRAINSLRVDMHQKMAFPWQNFVVIFLGLPFALMTKSRKGMTFVSVFISLAVAFAYYVLSAVFLAFGKGGLLPPVMAAWIPPALFLGTGLIIIEYHFGR